MLLLGVHLIELWFMFNEFIGKRKLIINEITFLIERTFNDLHSKTTDKIINHIIMKFEIN